MLLGRNHATLASHPASTASSRHDSAISQNADFVDNEKGPPAAVDVVACMFPGP